MPLSAIPTVDSRLLFGNGPKGRIFQTNEKKVRRFQIVIDTDQKMAIWTLRC